MKRVILDTNFLISLIRFKIDLDEIRDLIDENYELMVPDLVINELKNLLKNSDAKMALKLIDIKNIKKLKSEERTVDNELINLANKNIIIATNDIQLRKKLKEKITKTIYLRGRKHLAIG